MDPTSSGLERPAATRSAADDQSVERTTRIAVLRNPRSHRNRRGVEPDPDDPDLLVAAPRNRAELADTLARFADIGIDLLIVDGGDGTMREVMSAGLAAFGETWPKLLVLPKGKTNALALDLGMPGKMSLAQALRAVPHAREERRRPILVERIDAPGRRVLGFILGAGVFNTAIAAGQVAHRFGAFQGFAVALTALAGVAQALFGIGRGPWRQTAGMRVRPDDGGDVPHSRHGNSGERYGLGLSTLRRFPLGMRPFAASDRALRYIVVDAPLRRVMALVPTILMGLDRPFLSGLGVHRGGADSVTLELDGSFILDGEDFPPGVYGLRPGPELRFIVP